MVEMMIALVVLSVILLGIMMGMTANRGLFNGKEHEEARLLCLSVLEDLEATKSADLADKQATSLYGKYTIDKSFDIGPSSSLVEVTVRWDSDNGNPLTMRREVSFSGWQNVGLFPK